MKNLVPIFSSKVDFRLLPIDSYHDSWYNVLDPLSHGIQLIVTDQCINRKDNICILGPQKNKVFTYEVRKPRSP